MFKVVLEDLPNGEIAAIYQEGEDVLIMVSRTHSDEVRCDALNQLYAQITPPGPRQCPVDSGTPRLALSVAVA